MLTINVGLVDSKFSEAPSDAIVEKIREHLRYKNDADNPFVKRKFSYKNVEIAEYKYLYHKGRKSFPTGLLDVVEKILKDNQVDYKISDQRPDYPIIAPKELLSYKLRDYQMKAEEEALKAKNCTIKIATGGGKTAIISSICAKLSNYKRLILVRRQMLMQQTIEVLERELGEKVGQIGAGVVYIQSITVGMVPSLARALDPKWKFVSENDDDEDDKTKISEEQRESIVAFIKSVECVIPDEMHMLGADTAQLIMNNCVSARYKTGFSATPWRVDGKDILLTAVTGPKVVDIDASTLINRGFLVPPHIYFFKTPEVRLPLFMQGKYQDVYKEFIVENESRNQMIVDKAITAYNKFEKVLILVQQLDHGKRLVELLEAEGAWVETITGSKTMISRKEIMNQFQLTSRSILVATNGVLSEGIDLPEITVLINASAGASSVVYYQKIGRCIRLAKDKKRAIVMDFLDQNIKFMNRHAQERIRIIKTESLYKLKIEE